ncbi:PadR family transcriptional regulator [Haloarchaeobius baliensis]|uniref:PadR family transcriptional regulator n=1 Tax=Haloarchaeobius baliensis TaxID=1670458 RepID=UPI003F884005
MSRAAPDGGGAGEPEPNTPATRAADLELSAFQLRILSVLHDREREYGLGVKRAVEAYYGHEINHGRLYQNLNRLVDEGLVAKSVLDGRTNLYSLTDRGAETLFEEVDHLVALVDSAGASDPDDREAE